MERNARRVGGRAGDGPGAAASRGPDGAREVLDATGERVDRFDHARLGEEDLVRERGDLRMGEAGEQRSSEEAAKARAHGVVRGAFERVLCAVLDGLVRRWGRGRVHDFEYFKHVHLTSSSNVSTCEGMQREETGRTAYTSIESGSAFPLAKPVSPK